ncbi:hypothetical protein AOLI_G00244550 [Acnodon oligacanthus]
MFNNQEEEDRRAAAGKINITTQRCSRAFKHGADPAQEAGRLKYLLSTEPREQISRYVCQPSCVTASLPPGLGDQPERDQRFFSLEQAEDQRLSPQHRILEKGSRTVGPRGARAVAVVSWVGCTVSQEEAGTSQTDCA